MAGKEMSAGMAIYLAGVAFSFGLWLRQVPLPDMKDPESMMGFFAKLCVAFFYSVAFSWLGAGLIFRGL